MDVMIIHSMIAAGGYRLSEEDCEVETREEETDKGFCRKVCEDTPRVTTAEACGGCLDRHGTEEEEECNEDAAYV